MKILKKISLFSLLLAIGTAQAQDVKSVSAMRKVMMGEDLSSHLLWDTIAHKNLYGISPLGRIEGEITIIDGKIYTATVVKGNTITIRENWQSKAPFGVYAHVEAWQKVDFQATVNDEAALQTQIEKIAKARGLDISKAFPFRLVGDFEAVDFHIISKPLTETEHDHDLHDKAKKHFSLKNVSGEILGFYSQNHIGVFTHRGSFVHTHFIDDSRKNMGHLEGLTITKPMVLYLPAKYATTGLVEKQTPSPKESSWTVFTVGSMQDMGKNDFAPHIQLDTISQKSHLYAMGPYGKMQGEITVFDGKPFFVTAYEAKKAMVSLNWQIKSPFFVSANVAAWQVFDIQTPITDMMSLQKTVADIAQKNGYDVKTPFPFRIKGNFDTLTTHIVTPRSADVQGFRANVKQEDFTEINQNGELLGFYSESHQGIFTGKNSFIHVHYLSDDLTMMGHLDKVFIGQKVQLFLPLKN